MLHLKIFSRNFEISRKSLHRTVVFARAPIRIFMLQTYNINSNSKITFLIISFIGIIGFDTLNVK